MESWSRLFPSLFLFLRQLSCVVQFCIWHHSCPRDFHLESLITIHLLRESAFSFTKCTQEFLFLFLLSWNNDKWKKVNYVSSSEAHWKAQLEQYANSAFPVLINPAGSFTLKKAVGKPFVVPQYKFFSYVKKKKKVSFFIMA